MPKVKQSREAVKHCFIWGKCLCGLRSRRVPWVTPEHQCPFLVAPGLEWASVFSRSPGYLTLVRSASCAHGRTARPAQEDLSLKGGAGASAQSAFSRPN